MKPSKSLLLLAAFATMIISCKKDDSNASTNKIEGTWKFAGVSAHTEATDITTSADGTSKSITFSDYVSTKNVGTVSLTGGKFANVGVGYDVNTTMTNISIDGDTRDTLTVPYTFSSPAASSAGTYRLAGDSIFFGASLVTAPGNEDIPSANVTGGKISWSGDTLVITGKLSVAYSSTIEGVTISVNETALTTTKLVK